MKNNLKYIAVVAVLAVAVLLFILHSGSASPAEAYLADPINDSVAGKLYGEILQELVTISVKEEELRWVALAGGEGYASDGHRQYKAIVCYQMEQNGDKYSLGRGYELLDPIAILSATKDQSTSFSRFSFDGGTVYLQILPSSLVTDRTKDYTYVDLTLSVDGKESPVVLIYKIEN